MEVLDSLHAGDLFLAFACAHGDAQALEHFERDYAPIVRAALEKLRIGEPALDERVQAVREKLFLAEEGRAPKIAEYAGRGPLSHWLRVVATRVGINWLRRHTAEDEQVALDEELPDLAVATPELTLLQKRHQADIIAALKAAVSELPEREQNVLRLWAVDGLTTVELGKLYGLNHSNISRMLGRARKSVLKRTRRLLGERLKLSPAEVDSLTGLLQTELEVSLRGLFAAKAPSGR
jgi:RNA polymerase sigma-70 factor (ECF subfamily)